MTTFSRKFAVASLALAAATGAFATSASAAPKHGQGFVVYEQKGDTVKKVYDDGNLDGRGCIVGKVAVFDPKTGGLKQVPKMKCNF